VPWRYLGGRGDARTRARIEKIFRRGHAPETVAGAIVTAARATARRRGSRATRVYVSWNGATEVASYEVLSGSSPRSLASAGRAPRRGFETAITVNAAGPFFAVRALDARGRTLGTSSVVRRH